LDVFLHRAEEIEASYLPLENIKIVVKEMPETTDDPHKPARL
jgi:hypothetical protein